MKHKYYLTNNLDELEHVHDELMQSGLKDEQIHVLSDDEQALPKHHLQSVNEFAKTDIVRSTLRGAAIGVLLSSIVLLVPLIFNLTTPIGMLPFVFAALVVLGFSTWEGGLWGIQMPNTRFEGLFEKIHNGEHLLIVDYDESQEDALAKTESAHPMLQPVTI
jgi:hypothetical protein